MIKKYFCEMLVFLVIFFSQEIELIAQDKLILINGDTLNSKIVRIASGRVVAQRGSVEIEVHAGFISELHLSDGNKTVYRKIPANRDFQRSFFVMEYSTTLLNEINLMFPNAQMREFKKEFIVDRTTDKQITKGMDVHRYIEANPTGITEDEKVKLDYFRFLGYTCNAFLGLVSINEEGLKYTFFFNPVESDLIKKLIVGNTYKLTKSEVSNTVVEDIDKTTKPFVMTLNPGNECIFTEGTKNTMLEYEILDGGQLAFFKPKKKSDPMIYQVVFINPDFMRYTNFSNGRELLTRTVEKVQSNAAK